MTGRDKNVQRTLGHNDSASCIWMLAASLTSSIHGQEIVSGIQVNLQLVEWILVVGAQIPGACLERLLISLQ